MDGRKCCIYLPNDRKLELTVHPKQLGKDLFDIVVSEFRLKEQYFFGLTFKTSGEHYAWLQDDKKVLDHDTEIKSTNHPLEFIFSVKFYEDSVTVHKHASTVELIFLHARNLIYKGEIDVSSELSFHLSALVLQAVHGDYKSTDTKESSVLLQLYFNKLDNDEESSDNFRKLPCLPSRVLEEHPSLEYCEEEILTLYKGLQGVSRGQAILLYMSKVEKLPNYGVHYYKVRDKSRIPWWLGISNKGIYQYNFHDKVTPHIVFQWRNLENLYFREKKFSVEICTGHRHRLNSKNDSGNNQQAPKTHTWYGSPELIKSIWIMAIAQHQFYWDRKQPTKSKSNHSNKNNQSNLCTALNKNSKSLLNPLQDDNMQRKNVKKVEVTVKKGSKQQSPEIRALQKKMAVDLKKRKLDLEDRLYDKVQELKEICRQEYDITEKLPIEYLRYLLPGEDRPTVRRKVGAEFTVTLNKKQSRVPSGSIPMRDHKTSEELRQLEEECELLHQITKAAHKLAHDPATNRRTRKKRLVSYQKSLKKLQDVENRIDELRKTQGKHPAERASAFITASDLEIISAMKESNLDTKSNRSSLSDGMMLDDETSVSSGAEALSTHSTPALSFRRPDNVSADVDLAELPSQRSKTPPPTRSKVAWLESPKSKNREISLSKNGSYPILPSPASYSSNASQSSGTPPQIMSKRNWIEPKWEHARHHNGWKVSSLDSLESIGSRRSNEQGNASDVASSPVTNAKNLLGEENANSMRIARHAESLVHAHKVNLRDKRRKSESEPSRRMGTINPVVEIFEGTIVEDGKDSRTSLTDSGHVSSSENRLQSGQEDDVPRHIQVSNTMRREISDSSLSELSTQSNPAALPSSGHHPKFYPPFLSGRNRTHTHINNGRIDEDKVSSHSQDAQGHVRKRSSSFTESGSNVQKVAIRRDSHRTLTRPRAHNSQDTLPQTSDPDQYSYPNGDLPNRVGKDGSKVHPGLSTSQSAQELPPPMFDTNLNICRQYLSRSQGQLAQNNNNNAAQNSGQYGEPNTLASPSKTSIHGNEDHPGSNAASFGPAHTAHRYRYNISANNSNNKLNFGQIYKMSQNHANPDMMRVNSQPNPHAISQNGAIPKCNSLDSILDSSRPIAHSVNPDTVKNYSQLPQNPREHQYDRPEMPSNRTTPSPFTDSQVSSGHLDLEISNLDRDKYNNEAFQDIRGMAWVPSLDDYGSRASVAESLPAKSKKEDIMSLLQQHIAHHWRPNRSPSTASSATPRNKAEVKLRAKIRAEMMKEKESENNHQINTYPSKTTEPSGKTWEGYKKMQTLKMNQNRNNQNQPAVVSETSIGNPVNIFRHNPPPPMRQNQQEQPRNQPAYYPQPDGMQINSQTIRKAYVDQNGFVVPMPVNESRHRPSDMGYPNNSYNGNPTYCTIKPQKTTYPNYSQNPKASPFDRAFQSATLPRHYSSSPYQQNSPTYTQHWVEQAVGGSARSSASFDAYTHTLPRTQSHHGTGGSPNAKFHPIPTSTVSSNQFPKQSLPMHNSDQYMLRYAPTPLYASPPHAAPNTGDAKTSENNFYKPPQAAPGYRYQVKSQGQNITPMQHLQDQTNSQYQSMQQSDSKNRTKNKTGKDGALVIQALTTSPDGHTVSLFTVTKSAPNTPLPNRKQDGNPIFPISDEDSCDDDSGFLNPNNPANRNTPDGGSIVSMKQSKDKSKGQANAPKVLIHTPSSRNQTIPKLVAVKDHETPKSTSRNNSDTDMLQAIAIEAARAAQKNLRSSQDNLTKFDSTPKPPALPTIPPNSSLRSSKRFRNKNPEISGQQPSPRSERAKTPKPSQESKGKDVKPKGKDLVTGLASSDNGFIYKVKDIRGRGKVPTTPQPSSLTPPNFMRTLSTPSRAKPISLPPSGETKQGGYIPSKTKTTGMYKESLSGPAARSLPPAGPRNHVTSAPIPNHIVPSGKEFKQQHSPRPTYHISQSGTLPRTPRSRKKLERSGSSNGSVSASPNIYNTGHASPIHNQTPQQNMSTEYFHTTRRSPNRGEALNALRVEEDLKFRRKSYVERSPSPSIKTPQQLICVTKPPLPSYQFAARKKTASVTLKPKRGHRRSLSDTWNQPQKLVTVQMPHHHSPILGQPHAMYHHQGHHGMIPTSAANRSNQPPRRTASADDLLWSPDIEQNSYTIAKQHGTLV